MNPDRAGDRRQTQYADHLHRGSAKIIILAIILPPVGAALQVGITTHFRINLILTLPGAISGIIHAPWLILTDRRG